MAIWISQTMSFYLRVLICAWITIFLNLLKPDQMAKGIIKVLRNDMGVGVVGSGYFSITKLYGPMLVALRGGRGVSIIQTRSVA